MHYTLLSNVFKKMFFSLLFSFTLVKYTDTIPDMYLGNIYKYQKCVPILENKQ